MTTMWEDLRKRARATENSIDVKLVSLNKLNAHTGKLDNLEKNIVSRQAVFDNLTEEIDSLLAKLNNINDEMTDLVNAQSSQSWSQVPSVQHTLRRHREILRDYGTEFRRARDNVHQQLQREMLMSNSTGSDGTTCLNNRVKASDMYMKETEHIASCSILLDEQMDIAISTKENLSRQSNGLRGITRKMAQISHKYPMLNNVMQKIQSKKRRDTVVMATVISTCLIFMLYYLMH